MIVTPLPRWIAGFATALALGGCVSDGGGSSISAMNMAGGAGLAFDSVDGPPPQVFNRFVEALNTEAQARALPTTSRQEPSAYRVRAYLAAQTSRKQTSIAWVFDIYEAGQQRTLRLSGEEPVGRAARGDAWAAADEQLLRRIAQKGLADVAALMNGGAPAGTSRPSSAPATAGPAVANAAESAPHETETAQSYRSAFASGTD